MSFKKGDIVKVLLREQPFGEVLFVSGDDVTVLIDGYAASNTFKPSELEKQDAPM